MTEPYIMTIEEVAKYLRVSERTVYDWANRGAIPCGKLGTVWRFKRKDIENWVNDRLNSQVRKPESSSIGLQHLIHRDRVLVLDEYKKSDVLERMLNNLSRAPQVKDSKELAEAMYHREELMSTGIGKHIAVPHVRLHSVMDLVMTVAFNKHELADYETLDGEPVRLLFMIAAHHNQHAQYLRILREIAGLTRNQSALDAILGAKSEEDLFKLLMADKV